MAIRVPERPPAIGIRRARTPAAVSVSIQPMRRRHLRSVMRIETKVYPKPWSPSLFLSELSMKSTRDYFIARVGGEIAGYAGMMVAGDEAHITTVAVDPAHHRKHIAMRLMIQLIRSARTRGVKHMTLEVRVTNRAAQNLYYRFGFAPAGVRKNYYTETREDALIMWVHDIDTDKYRSRAEKVGSRITGTTSWADAR